MRATRWWSRALAGALTVWFGLVMAAPAVLHSCPMMLASASAAAGMEHGGHGTRHGSGQQGNLPTNCQCLGSCIVSAPAMLAPPTTVPVAIVAPLVPDALPPVAAIAVTPAAEHLQPFATAPPALLG
jgi:hypothetical protein